MLPTEFGQTEGMKGAVFLVDRQNGHGPRHLPVGRGRGNAGERERGDPRSRGSHRTRRDGVGGALRGGAPERRAGGLGRLSPHWVFGVHSEAIPSRQAAAVAAWCRLSRFRNIAPRRSPIRVRRLNSMKKRKSDPKQGNGGRLSLSADRCEDQGAGRLAGRDARSGPDAHQAGRPRRGRGVEVERSSGLVARTESSAPVRRTRTS